MSLDVFFNDESPLINLIPDFKFRKYQRDLSLFIKESIDNYCTSVVEAPTGSGKTLAYLIPSFLSNKKIIISTKSKQLMNQLFFKDIKVLKELNICDRKVSILKGKKNYFCIYRFYKYILPFQEEYQDVIKWYSKNDEKDILEVPYYLFDESVYDKMTADSFQCLAGKCEYYERCHYYKAKDIANASDIVITNHYLLLTDIASKSKSGFLSNFENFEHIIFDEAHSIIDIFPMFAGEEVSVNNLKSFLKDCKTSIRAELYTEITNKIRLFETKIKVKKTLNDKHMEAFEQIIDFIRGNILEMLDDEDIESFKKIEKSYKYILEHEGVKVIEPTKQSVLIKLLPLKVDDIFYNGLLNTCISATFISATLTSDKSFEFFKKELGLPLNTSEYIVDKDNFKKNSVYVIPKKIEDKKKFYIEAVKSIDAPMLLIFNSINMMNIIYDELSQHVTNKNILLQHSVNMGEFFADSKDVILGCAVLREGIDIKTNSRLKCVIIDKLPFENISDVYLEMKANEVQASGKNPFMDFYLPRAVIFFKQAIGRLIRSEEDNGLCIILDERILNKSYGKYFLEEIDENRIYHSVADALNALEEINDQSKT
ncbi:MAG: ATP-dependent helicase DinG [Deferribacteres bacterium]|jgi:ATP-dependent DNA helicase DinG|nr:box helicase domain protein [Deferribacteraceae bacterium]MDK2791304.1 ATP-dependent helicase DinG [Deferribacteres bacterium]